MEKSCFDFPQCVDNKLTSMLAMLPSSVVSSCSSFLYRAFKICGDGFWQGLYSKHVAAYSYAAASGVYCFFMIYNYRKFSEKLNEFKAILEKKENFSKETKTFFDDIESYEKDNLDLDKDLIEQLTALSSETEEKIIMYIVANIKKTLKRIQSNYHHILLKYRNCLESLKKLKNWWNNGKKIAFGLFLFGIIFIIGFTTAGAGSVTLGAVSFGLVASSVSVTVCHIAENECDQMIELIDKKIQFYKQQKESRLEQILNLIKELESKESNETKEKLNSEMRQMRNDILKVMENCPCPNNCESCKLYEEKELRK